MKGYDIPHFHPPPHFAHQNYIISRCLFPTHFPFPIRRLSHPFLAEYSFQFKTHPRWPTALIKIMCFCFFQFQNSMANSFDCSPPPLPHFTYSLSFVLFTIFGHILANQNAEIKVSASMETTRPTLIFSATLCPSIHQIHIDFGFFVVQQPKRGTAPLPSRSGISFLPVPFLFSQSRLRPMRQSPRENIHLMSP